MSGVKTTIADTWFSRCVRERAGWTCERCGRYYPEVYRAALECSHHYGRKSWSVRFDPKNAESLCRACHCAVGGSKERRSEVLDDDEHAALRIRLRDTNLGKTYKKTGGKGEIARHYKDELVRMQKMRDDGETGRIEFEAWV